MSININFLDFLYDDYFTSLSQAERLEQKKDFPDDCSSIIHGVELQHARRSTEKAKNRIHSYIEHHSKGEK